MTSSPPMQAAQRALWTPDELSTHTRGLWARRPGPAWRPGRVSKLLRWDHLGPRMVAFVQAGLLTPERLPTDPLQLPGGCLVAPATRAAEALGTGAAVLLVDEPMSALRRLAAAARDRFQGRVALVTGTVGKTTTQRMIGHLLTGSGSTALNDHNLRDEIFQFVATASPQTGYLVTEAGMGEYLDALGAVARVVRPHVAVLTHSGLAHVDLFPGKHTQQELLKRVLGQKVQIFSAMASPSTAVLNGDIENFDMALSSASARADETVSFGKGPHCDYRLLTAESVGDSLHVRANLRGRPVEFTMQTLSTAVVLNGLGALAAAVAMGLDLDAGIERLERFQPVGGRDRLHRLRIDGRPIHLIDGSFNATPIAVRSGLELLSSVAARAGGRRIAVLGDISHLGAGAAAVHAGLGEAAETWKVDRLYTFGSLSEHLQRAVPEAMRAGHFTSKDELIAALIQDLRADDAVIVKASMPSNFHVVVRALLAKADPKVAAQAERKA